MRIQIEEYPLYFKVGLFRCDVLIIGCLTPIGNYIMYVQDGYKELYIVRHNIMSTRKNFTLNCVHVIIKYSPDDIYLRNHVHRCKKCP